MTFLIWNKHFGVKIYNAARAELRTLSVHMRVFGDTIAPKGNQASTEYRKNCLHLGQKKPCQLGKIDLISGKMCERCQMKS
jgi:hypothetical protein